MAWAGKTLPFTLYITKKDGSFEARLFKFVQSACYLHHVSLSVHMYQLGSHWTDLREVDNGDVCENLSRKPRFS
jgi:hypothetical protein